jgi:hypothetical protein
MVINISPLELMLDAENPRFVILASREQDNIRKYLVTYEDVCQLASDINDYGSLLPGERIVALQENGRYIVVEGNRRTCSLQFLLNRELIPDGFVHRIPHASARLLENCQSIEVDVLPDRDAALELMTKRHIEGIKQWKPLAKKQFFAANYRDGHGQSISNLSRITGISEGDIRQDIREYKFFFSTYERYTAIHQDFDKEIIVLKTDPFWRIFKVKFEFPLGSRVSPTDLLKITYDDTLNTISSLDNGLFEQITDLVFEQTIVTEQINTRNVLTDVVGILPLLNAVTGNTDEENTSPADNPSSQGNPPNGSSNGNSSNDGSQPSGSQPSDSQPSGSQPNGQQPGGPQPGGPPPRSFFETISWRNKLNPSNQQHQGLLYAINELYGLSNTICGRQKAYRTFPIATGMILRTVYEQALRLRLMQVGLWGSYCNTRNGTLPTLKTIEDFINQAGNKSTVFPMQDMILIYDRVIAATHRDFLNANIHYPGNINVTPDSLEAIAAGGMYALIQGIINLI